MSMPSLQHSSLLAAVPAGIYVETQRWQQHFMIYSKNLKNGGTEMAATLHVLKQKFEDGPPPSDAHTSYLYYLHLREEVEDFLSLLQARYWASPSTPEEDKQPYTGEKCTPEDRPLFEQAVDLHQLVVDKIIYWQFGHANQHTKNIPSRQLYHATDSRMPRYDYGFK